MFSLVLLAHHGGDINHGHAAPGGIASSHRVGSQLHLVNPESLWHRTVTREGPKPSQNRLRVQIPGSLHGLLVPLLSF